MINESALKDTESSMSKSTGASSSKESKRSKKSSKKKESEAEQQSELESEVGLFKPSPSNFLSELQHANQEYFDVWRDKDERANLDQGPYYDMVEAEKTREVEDEVRVGVDQAMRGRTGKCRSRSLK